MTIEPPVFPLGNSRPIKIEEEMRTSYLDYAMSVIVSRALPDIRDGLKPVQRRILYAMSDMSLTATSSYKKSARIVGEVLGKYHPHGDSPVYEAMVRLAQPFSLRYPLVDGQGNFGSMDNDPPAAMRYTEARLSAVAMELLVDLDKDTVDMFENFDGSLKEPLPLPARLPNLLANGASGIAVGMATNIPPHNLTELCDAIILLIDDPETTGADLADIVTGPDFPTGGVAFRFETHRIPGVDGEGPTTEKRDAIRTAYAEGRGRVVVRARVHVEETAKGSRNQIIVTELPYQTNKAALVEKIANLVRAKKIEGISDLRDESDRHGMRIVIELKREAQPKQLLNALYKHTAMQSAFAVNMLALVDGQPRTVSLKKILESFIDHRRDVIRRRSEFELNKARDRAHVLEGLLKAIDMLDEVIKTIRGAASADDAKTKLMAKPFDLTDRQAQAVLDLQLRRLARLERDKIKSEYAELLKQINYLEDLLANPRKIDFLIRDDAEDVKDKFGDERRTLIMDQEPEEFSEEDMVAHQEVVVTISSRGYIKRIPLDTYRSQRRGGVGIIGARTKDDDDIRHLVVADTHDRLIFFTDRGRCFQVKTWEVDEGKREARGASVMQLLMLDQSERITAVVRTPTGVENEFMVMGTKLGEAKKTPMKNFANVRRDGLIAMNLEPADELVSAHICSDDDDVIMVTASGQAIRFAVRALRSASRLSGGVRGIKLKSGDAVIGLEIAREGYNLLVASAQGHGKRTPVEEYPRHNRGGQGVITFKTHKKSGPLVHARAVDPEHELMMISENGIMLRTPVMHISKQGRPTQGVKLMDVGDDDRVAAIAIVDMRRDYLEAGDDLPTGAEQGENGEKAKGEAKATAKPAAKAKAKPAAKPKAKKAEPKASGNSAKPKPRSGGGKKPK
ncbi:MAG: DNA gyrase subunit A [Chloroflexi bacterium]|nr:DNA gyrase subunit A [Chloroflexota bacterium]